MRKTRKLAALCAAIMFALCLCSTAVFAEEAPVVSGAESSAPSIEAVLPPGTGAVAEIYADENGRKFYTIQTPAGNTFYLIIDFTKESENVYFLDAVSEKDLLALAEKSGGTAAIETENSDPGTDKNSKPTAEPSAGSSADSGNSLFSMILVGAVVLIGGGAGLYFAIARKKRGNDTRGEYEEEEYVPEEPETDLPPWEDDNV